jgi:hypothetical protein
MGGMLSRCSMGKGPRAGRSEKEAWCVRIMISQGEDGTK